MLAAILLCPLSPHQSYSTATPLRLSPREASLFFPSQGPDRGRGPLRHRPRRREGFPSGGALPPECSGPRGGQKWWKMKSHYTSLFILCLYIIYIYYLDYIIEYLYYIHWHFFWAGSPGLPSRWAEDGGVADVRVQHQRHIGNQRRSDATPIKTEYYPANKWNFLIKLNQIKSNQIEFDWIKSNKLKWI